MKSLDNITVREIRACAFCPFKKQWAELPPFCGAFGIRGITNVIEDIEVRPEWCPLPILIEGV